MPPVRPGPAIGLIGQVALLAILAKTVGLGAAGWITGVLYGFALCVLAERARRGSGIVRFGPADRVTLTRATLVGCVTALTVESFTRPTPVFVLVGIATVALVLDAVDGQVARRTASASGFGARFDMEVDAFLIFVLSVYLTPALGAWVLAIGAMRYTYVVAGWALPWLRGTPPPRFWCKVVAAIQGIVLVVAAADVLPTLMTVGALLVALALLLESFGRDVIWLWRHRVTSAHATSPHAPGVDVPRAAQWTETLQQSH